jgi:hypothetical protein
MHRHTRETRKGGWELGIWVSVSADQHKNTFSGFGSFYPFFVQIKIVDSRLVIMQSNLRLLMHMMKMMMMMVEREEKEQNRTEQKRKEKEALTGQSGACAPPPRPRSLVSGPKLLHRSAIAILASQGGGRGTEEGGKGGGGGPEAQSPKSNIPLRTARRNIGCGA